MMNRHQKSILIGTLCGGGAIELLALAVLMWGLKNARLNLISDLALAFLIIGGLVLCILAAKTMKLLNIGKTLANKIQKGTAKANNAIERRFASMRSLSVLLVCGALFLGIYLHTASMKPEGNGSAAMGISYARAKVISIQEDAYERDPQMENLPFGHQMVEVEIQSGPNKGSQAILKNYLSHFYGSVLKPGDHVVVSYSSMNGENELVMLQDFDRAVPLIFVVALFLGITIMVGGKVGAKSLLGLGCTVLCIFTIMIPRLIAGAPTIPTVLMICAFVTVVTFVILDGVNRKTVCAIFGTILGVSFSAMFGKFACWLLRVSGLSTLDVDPTIEFLVQIKQDQILQGLPSIQLADLLVAGILIAALGAVNDVAMSISSALNELVAVNENLSRKELFKSGMNIGRDMVGTMTNTLILAFVGGGLVTMIYLYSLEPTFRQFMSTSYLSVEIVQVLASSMGVIVGVPLSVSLGAVLFGGRKRMCNERGRADKEN